MLNFYRISWNNLIGQSLAIAKRTPFIIAFLKSYLTPFKTLHNTVVSYKLDVEYRLRHNSQVCYLRKLVNDKFDSSLRRITIEDGTRYDRLFIYQQAENKPLFLLKFIQQQSAYDNAVDFVVKLNGVVLDNNKLNRLKAYLDFYKLASKKYRIE